VSVEFSSGADQELTRDDQSFYIMSIFALIGRTIVVVLLNEPDAILIK
jgi:hypothetical protein